MGLYDNYASQFPYRTKNFIQEIKYNSENGLYETVISPHVGYDAYSQPSGTTTPSWNPCPAGQVMGPDGVCRIDTNYEGQTVFPDVPDVPEVSEVPEVPEVPGGGGGAFTSSEPTAADEAYQRQQDLYKRVTSGEIGGTARNDKYQTLPGGMKNWTDAQLYQWALDNQYFTKDDRMALDIPVPGEYRYADYNKKIDEYFSNTMMGQMFQKLGDWRSQKGFDDWLDLAQKRGIIEKEGEKWKILVGPGDNKDSLYAGGYLVPLDEFKRAEVDYAQGYFTPSGIDKKVTQMNLSGGKDDLTYDWAMRFKLGNEYLPELRNDQQIDILTNNIEKWQTKLASMHETGEGTGWWEWIDKREMDNLASNITKAEERIVYLAPTTSGFESYTPGHFDLQKNYIWGTINSTNGNQVDIGHLALMTGQEQQNFWKAQAGIPKGQFDQFQLAPSPHTEQPRIISKELEAPSAKLNLSTPVLSSDMNSMQLTSTYGDTISGVTRVQGGLLDTITGKTTQVTDIVSYSKNDGSPGNHNQDGTTADWGYDADGRFVNVKTGQTAAMGSMSDAVKSINDGNASSKLLDRFAWGHSDNTTGYKSKEEYMAAKDTKVTYRNNDGNQSTVSSDNYDAKDDNSKGKIICDYFYRKGLLSEKLWKADEAYGEELLKTEPDVMKGYHAWARHYVREMEKESLLGKIYFAWAKLWVPHWAKYLAGEKTIRGKILHSIGKPICNMIGKFNRRIKWQEA